MTKTRLMIQAAALCSALFAFAGAAHAYDDGYNPGYDQPPAYHHSYEHHYYHPHHYYHHDYNNQGYNNDYQGGGYQGGGYQGGGY